MHVHYRADWTCEDLLAACFRWVPPAYRRHQLLWMTTLSNTSLTKSNWQWEPGLPRLATDHTMIKCWCTIPIHLECRRQRNSTTCINNKSGKVNAFWESQCCQRPEKNTSVHCEKACNIVRHFIVHAFLWASLGHSLELACDGSS